MKDIVDVKKDISIWYRRQWKEIDGQIWYRESSNDNYQKLSMSEFQDFLYYLDKYFT